VLARLMHKCARARGFYSIYMTLGGVLAMTLAATMPRLTVLRTSRTAWYAVAWAVSLTALALTYVRGAWLGLAAAIALILAVRRNYAVLATAIVVAAALLVMLPSVSHRMRTIGDPADPTTRERMAMIHAGLRLLRDHPITGIGPGQVKRAYPIVAPPEAVRRSTSHLHNTPLQIAVERGVPGLGLWLAVWAAFFVQAVRIAAALPEGQDRLLVFGSIAAIAAFLVGGLFEYNFGDTEVLFVALALMAVPFVVQRAPSS
jgi:O-antigen ligase